MTETDIQIGLYVFLERKRHKCITPNAHLFVTGEMDMASVMKSGKVCEYEIKISRSDFKADLKKDKHRMIEKRLLGQTHDERSYFHSGRKYQIQIKTANYFSYVVPEGLVTTAEVPTWAGLIYIGPRIYQLNVVKKPVQIHAEIDSTISGQLGHKLMYRFWNLKRSAYKETTDHIKRLT